MTRRAVRRVWEDGTGKIRHATAQAGWAGGLFALRVTRRGTGRLEALRLEGFEVLTVVSIDWLVGWLIVCLANVT